MAAHNSESKCDRNHVPEEFRLIYTSEQIAARTAALGAEISPWAIAVSERSGADVVAVAVLRGGIFFFSDLVRCISTSVEVAPVRTVGYDPRANTSLVSVKVIADALQPDGRSLLLIDDICDSGRTFEGLVPLLKERGAVEVRSAALVRRLLPHKTFKPDWVGFEFTGEEWLVGYGMDDAERWRNLPGVYGMAPRVSSEGSS